MGLENLQRIASEAAARSQTLRMEKKERPNPTAWRLSWQDTMREFYPEAVVGYTTIDARNLKQAVARGIPVGEVSELIAWAVSNWEVVRRKISNTDKPIGPSVPDMRYFIYQIGKIHAAYRQRRDGATLDLAKRRQSLQPAAQVPEPAQARKPLPRIPLAHKPLAPPAAKPKRPQLSSDQSDSLRQRLGLPRFEDIHKAQ